MSDKLTVVKQVVESELEKAIKLRDQALERERELNVNAKLDVDYVIGCSLIKVLHEIKKVCEYDNQNI